MKRFDSKAACVFKRKLVTVFDLLHEAYPLQVDHALCETRGTAVTSAFHGSCFGSLERILSFDFTNLTTLFWSFEYFPAWLETQQYVWNQGENGVFYTNGGLWIFILKHIPEKLCSRLLWGLSFLKQLRNIATNFTPFIMSRLRGNHVEETSYSS